MYTCNSLYICTLYITISTIIWQAHLPMHNISLTGLQHFSGPKLASWGVWKISSSPKLAPKSPRRTVENLLTLAVNPQRIFSHPQTVWREAIFWTQKISFSPADHVRLHSDHPYLLWLQIFYIAKTDGRVQRRWQIMRLRLICHAPQFHNSYECSSQKNKKHFKYFQTTSRPPYCHKT